MTAEVQRFFPSLPSLAAVYVAKPFEAGLAAGFMDEVNHLLGMQTNIVHCQAFGATEDVATAGSATYPFLCHPSPNTQALLIQFVVMGSGSAPGTLSVPGADSTPLTYSHPIAGTPSFTNTAMPAFIKPVTADTLQEITYSVTNLRLHSVVAYEVPRVVLGAAHAHVARTFAWPNRVISDDPSTASDRGFFTLLERIKTARTALRRHMTPYHNPGTTVGNGVANGTPITVYGNLRFRARLIRSAASDDQGRVRFAPYISAATGTWTVRLRDSATTDTASIAGVTGAGWWTGTGAGVPANLAAMAAFQMEASSIDNLVVDVTRTAGVSTNTITLNGCSIVEDPS